jgi:D-alanine--poly(phosphoribitol) ligase subunit 1
VADLDAHCRESLPWYMVPGKFIFVEDFPLNPNGKIDRNALSEQYL